MRRFGSIILVAGAALVSACGSADDGQEDSDLKSATSAKHVGVLRIRDRGGANDFVTAILSPGGSKARIIEGLVTLLGGAKAAKNLGIDEYGIIGHKFKFPVMVDDKSCKALRAGDNEEEFSFSFTPEVLAAAKKVGGYCAGASGVSICTSSAQPGLTIGKYNLVDDADACGK